LDNEIAMKATVIVNDLIKARRVPSTGTCGGEFPHCVTSLLVDGAKSKARVTFRNVTGECLDLIGGTLGSTRFIGSDV
jgi:hypothetical protein